MLKLHAHISQAANGRQPRHGNYATGYHRHANRQVRHFCCELLVAAQDAATPTLTFSDIHPSIEQKGKETAKKGEGNKLVRIPRNELLDMLFTAFEQYDYWSMKNLVSSDRESSSGMS